jgi:arginase family enzyme
LIQSSLKPDEIQVVVGGDHSVSFSSLLALFSRFNPAEVGYIQFDAHGDIHLYATSPSKNFHGMYVRPFVEAFDLPVIANLVTDFLPAENIIYVGNMDLEPAEQEFFVRNNIRQVDQQELRLDKFKLELPIFINKFAHIHINFDIDVMDHSLVTATGIPAEQGLFWEEVAPVLNILKTHSSWSLDLVEVNPQKPGAAETIKVAHQILETLLGT